MNNDFLNLCTVLETGTHDKYNSSSLVKIKT